MQIRWNFWISLSELFDLSTRVKRSVSFFVTMDNSWRMIDNLKFYENHQIPQTRIVKSQSTDSFFYSKSFICESVWRGTLATCPCSTLENAGHFNRKSCIDRGRFCRGWLEVEFFWINNWSEQSWNNTKRLMHAYMVMYTWDSARACMGPEPMVRIELRRWYVPIRRWSRGLTKKLRWKWITTFLADMQTFLLPDVLEDPWLYASNSNWRLRIL